MVGRTVPWQDFESWKQHGIDHKYDERNPRSLAYSKNKQERSLYSKGYLEDWIEGFEFERLTLHGQFSSFDQWKEFGTNHKYNRKNPSTLANSENRLQRCWYHKGHREGWVKKFEFERLFKRLSANVKKQILEFITEFSDDYSEIARGIGVSEGSVRNIVVKAVMDGKLNSGYLRPNGALYLENVRRESQQSLEDVLE